MAKTQRKLNNASSKVIKENVLKEDPEGFPENNSIVIAKQIPAPQPMRKIVFLNGRDPGVPLEFHYHSGTHPLKHYKLYHGKEVELPEEIIQHLDNCAESIYGYRPGPEGHPEIYTKSKKYIFTCKTPKSA